LATQASRTLTTTSLADMSLLARPSHQAPAAAALWAIMLLGLFGLVLALIVLSGPGRIDIVDGQTRYEVARSLVDHGDTAIRDLRVWFNVLPGRDGKLFTKYRLPQSLAGAAAILASDLTGRVTEARRQFFFVLTGTVTAALLAVVYALWFRHLGYAATAAGGWALAGIVCTPSWFYATSTFDDLLGALFLVLALVTAFAGRRSRRLGWHIVAGAAVAVTFHCKPPLAVFVLAVLAAGTDPSRDPRLQSGRRLVVLAGLLLGLFLHLGYELYNFPPATRAGHAVLEQQYVAPWPGHPLAALAGLSLSPGKGAIWYCPPVLLGLAGLWSWRTRERWLVGSVVASTAVFVGFVSSLVIFSGDPTWGPRYLLPVFALLWLLAPEGARRLGGRWTASLLMLGFAVQAASLTVDPHRLYVERGLRSVFYADRPWAYFDPDVSHLLNRPREITEIAGSRHASRAPYFSPAPAPTFDFPVIDFMERGRPAVDKYHVLRSFRPWWTSQRYLSAADRPVDLDRWVAGTLALAAASLALIVGTLVRTGSGRLRRPGYGSRDPG
jgi:branched-subunit amino acid transport protein